ncbi:MAG: AmmeMemoRadiSam system protein A [Acidobacteriia bacterium]|nr:AmmeMemoRadiSam system protein A [Terriglobia bacterium]
MSPLSDSEKLALLALARRTIAAAVRDAPLLDAPPWSGILAEPRGIFVTLRCRGRLQGCIGVVEPVEPLGDSLVRCAVGAALNDPRFPALRAEALLDLHIEISLLSRLQPIRSQEIELGRHGLFLRRAVHRGLLLPQVATEYGFTRERFLEETCRKAGLSPGAWLDPETRLYAFTCEIIAELREGPPRP